MLVKDSELLASPNDFLLCHIACTSLQNHVWHFSNAYKFSYLLVVTLDYGWWLVEK